jgi:hypothetical protein
LLILTAALVIILVVIGGIIYNTASSSPGTPPVPSQASQQQTLPAATTRPASPPAASPTPLPASSGPAILGATLSAFVARYGQPNQHSMPASHTYYFSLYGTPGQDDLTVMLIDGQHVDAVTVASPTGAGWDESTAIAACLAFAPSDAVYQRQMIQTDATGALQDIQRVYLSPSLAQVFPASMFPDEHGNQATPGTIGLVLDDNLGNTNSFIDCTLQVGLQSS